MPREGTPFLPFASLYSYFTHRPCLLARPRLVLPGASSESGHRPPVNHSLLLQVGREAIPSSKKALGDNQRTDHLSAV